MSDGSVVQVNGKTSYENLCETWGNVRNMLFPPDGVNGNLPASDDQMEAKIAALVAENEKLKKVIKDAETTIEEKAEIKVGDRGVNGPGDAVATLASKVETLEWKLANEKEMTRHFFRYARRLKALWEAGNALYNAGYWEIGSLSDQDQAKLWEAFRDALGRKPSDEKTPLFTVDFLAGLDEWTDETDALRNVVEVMKADVDALRQNWADEKNNLERALRDRNYQISLLKRDKNTMFDLISLADQRAYRFEGEARKYKALFEKASSIVDMVKGLTTLGPGADRIDVRLEKDIR